MSLNPEQQYYENAQLWSAEHWRHRTADQQRVQIGWSWLAQDCQRLLDVGCGNGVFLHAAPPNVTAIGVDRSQAALQASGLPVIQASAAQLPFADNAFDAVACMEVLEHLPEAVFYRTLEELKRVTARYILITVPYCENLSHHQTSCPRCGCNFHPEYHLRSFRSRDLERLFQSWTGVSLIRQQAIVRERSQKRLGFLWNMVRLYLHHGGRHFPPSTICPQCGYRRPSTSTPRSPGRGSGMGRFWPAGLTYIWWMALYAKQEQPTRA